MNQEPYQPINCDVHDKLESFSTLHQTCEITYRDNQDNEVIVHDVIEDIYTKDHEEFMKLRRGTIIRLDQLVSLNGESVKERCDRI